MARVVVGLSGGVDSSVSAYLLKEAGHEVIGLFMKNWHDDSVTISDECPWLDDSNDALIVAEKLGIPFQTIDLSGPYKERIVDYMFSEYQHGRTPNPDVLCNREIKFDVFLDRALQLGADFVATGHYCQKGEYVNEAGKIYYQLLSGADSNKDQSYFLCQLSQEQLAKTLFPIGHLQKSEVRELARKADLVTAEKKDSQGLCFVGKVRLPEFLQQKLAPKQGKIIEVDAGSPLYAEQLKTGATGESLWSSLSKEIDYSPEAGKVVGEHPGAHFFTVGQRKGLDVGGTPLPLFVLQTDVERNIIYTGQGKDHPGLFRSALYISDEELHWIRPDQKVQPGESRRFQVRIRYRQPLQEATLYRVDEGLYIVFDQAQSAITPGQFAAWYDGQELMGSGVIA